MKLPVKHWRTCRPGLKRNSMPSLCITRLWWIWTPIQRRASRSCNFFYSRTHFLLKHLEILFCYMWNMRYLVIFVSQIHEKKYLQMYVCRIKIAQCFLTTFKIDLCWIWTKRCFWKIWGDTGHHPSPPWRISSILVIHVGIKTHSIFRRENLFLVEC